MCDYSIWQIFYVEIVLSGTFVVARQTTTNYQDSDVMGFYPGNTTYL